MSGVDEAFEEVDRSLNLDPAERVKAELRHNEIRTVLSSEKLISGSFLQGSFRRKTMLKPLKDVDIVCLLHEGDRERYLMPGGPRRALESFRRAVASKWPKAGFDENDPPAGKALCVSFPDCHFTIDLVAAIDTPTEKILIGDRDDDEWKPSTSRTLIRLISARNVATGGAFVHQVRIAKSLKTAHEELSEIAGIVFESLAYDVVIKAQAHKFAVLDILAHAAIASMGPIFDPALENDLTEKWSPGMRQAVARTFDKLSNDARRAATLDGSGDSDAAQELWAGILGSGFPLPVPRKPKDVMTAWASGSLTPTGRPVAGLSGGVRVDPGRGWLDS